MIENSNYTQVPNVILDQMNRLGNSEFKVIMAITRQTLGWHERSRQMSISVLEKLTGLSNKTIVAACQKLAGRGWITREQIKCVSGYTFEYSLLLDPDKDACVESTPLTCVESTPLTCVESTPLTCVESTHIYKETLLKEKEKKRSLEGASKSAASFSFSDLSQAQEPTVATGQKRSNSDRAVDNQKSECSAAPPYVVGIVTYAQNPSEIDLSELWDRNPGMVKDQVRYIAARHKYPDLVAHGLGELWVGPGRSDFDPEAIAIAQKRKRDRDEIADRAAAAGYIDNMRMGGKWVALEGLLSQAKDRRSAASTAEAEHVNSEPKRGHSRILTAADFAWEPEESPEERQAFIEKLKAESRAGRRAAVQAKSA